jgi:hypothetical protein
VTAFAVHCFAAGSALAMLSSAALSQTPSPLSIPAAANSADELAGLWKAKRWFGNFESTRLVIQRDRGAYTADMLGRIIPQWLFVLASSLAVPAAALPTSEFSCQ